MAAAAGLVGQAMIDRTWVATMARYNAWQNESLYAAAATLSDADRKLDHGAFFKSIHGTFNHLLWGDHNWMSRFAALPKPPIANAQSASWFEDFATLRAERVRFDRVTADWAAHIAPAWLDGEISWYSGALDKTMTAPVWLVVTHFFNHQTHHRGQAHAMLTAAGAKPDDTDLILLLDRLP